MVRVFEGQAELGKFVFEKTEIESGIVGDQWIGTDKAVKFGKNPVGGQLIDEHFVADTVDSAGSPRNRFVDLDEAVEFVNQATIFDDDSADFDDPVTVSGRETGGFKIKDNETL